MKVVVWLRSRMQATAARRTLPAARWAAAGLAAVLLAVSAQAADPLPSWTDGPARKAILAFVESTTTPSSPQFVPPAERIAVFDNDGTLWGEQPIYVQLAFALDRVKAQEVVK